MKREEIFAEECLCHNIDGNVAYVSGPATFHRNGDVSAEVRVILHIVDLDTGVKRSVTTVRRLRFAPD